MKAYKLFRKMKDGYAPLFINKKLRMQVGESYTAEDLPTKGFKQRFGWHCTMKPHAPHLKVEGTNRVWCVVEVEGDIEKINRGHSQGGTWVLCRGKLTILSEVDPAYEDWLCVQIDLRKGFE